VSGEQRLGDQALVTIAHPSRGGSLCAEGKLRRAGLRRGEILGRREPEQGRNAANPRVGSVLQDTRIAREEETGEVVRHHVVGTRMGSGFPIPKEGRRRVTGGWLPGVDSPVVETAEGIFGQPQERKFAVTETWRSNRKTGQRRESRREGQEGKALFPKRNNAPEGKGPRRLRRALPRTSKATGDSCEGLRAAPALRASPVGREGSLPRGEMPPGGLPSGAGARSWWKGGSPPQRFLGKAQRAAKAEHGAG